MTDTPSNTPEDKKIDRPIKKNLHPVTISVMIVAGAVLALGIIASIAFIAKNLSNNSSQNNSSLVDPSHDGNTLGTATEDSIANVADKVSPSVVSIVTTTQSRSFYGVSTGGGAGTGIIISKNGYILTNNHVIENSNSISIVDHKGNLYESVSLVGRDPLNDVAFLKVNSNDEFTPAEIGNSSTLRTGQQVVAIGNALGQYSNTVTSGIVSGTGRPIVATGGSGQAESLTDLIQTDASINSGNSGGPLVNLSGQVIGINTAVATNANGIGFAIPVNATKGMIRGVLDTGKVTRAYIGVNYLSITPEVAREYNLKTNAGAYIYASQGTNPVVSGGPAEKAGLKAGDIITKIDNSSIGKQGGLSSVIGMYVPGETVTVTYLRDGKENTTKLTFEAYQQNTSN